MDECAWFDSVVRSEMRKGSIEDEAGLSGFLSVCETEHGMSKEVGDRLFKKFKKEVC